MLNIKYSDKDKSGRIGIYCEKCNSILYLSEDIADQIFDSRKCPICNYRWIYYITNIYQPKGDGF